MLGCRSLSEGSGLRLAHLFEGFSAEPANLILVGIINLVLGIGLVVVMGLGLVGAAGAFATFAVDAQTGSGGVGATTGAIGGLVLVVLLMTLLSVPLTMAGWFAPALVVLNGMSPLDAIKMSFVGCLRNTVPFVVYGLVLLVLAIVGLLPLGLGLFVVIPVVWASMFFGYRDIFVR